MLWDTEFEAENTKNGIEFKEMGIMQPQCQHCYFGGENDTDIGKQL